MRARATVAPAAAKAPAPATSLAVQRCSCGSGEKDGECEECRREAVQARSLGDAPPSGDAGGPGFSLGNVSIFPPVPGAAGGGRVVQRSSAVDPPPGREEAEEAPGMADAGPRGTASAVEEGDDGEAVAGLEAGRPFGGGGAERPESPDGDEALQTSPATSISSAAGAATPRPGRAVDARAVSRRLTGGGRPLPVALRRSMERFFGRDLGGVRVHADDRSGRLARALSAEAFTVGEHVVFSAGAWRPGEAAGRELLAHELRHVLQQRAGLSGEVVRRGIGRAGDPWEREAEEASRELARREAREPAPAEELGQPWTDAARGVAREPVRVGHPSALQLEGGFWGFLEDVIEFIPDALAADSDFWENYTDMREANTIGADKYFHCKANCEAARRGPGGAVEAVLVSDLRELFDRYAKGDPAAASDADQAANLHGRNAGRNDRSVDCRLACAQFRPNGLDPRY